jgi:hypothetical protein
LHSGQYSDWIGGLALFVLGGIGLSLTFWFSVSKELSSEQCTGIAFLGVVWLAVCLAAAFTIWLPK